MLNNAKLWRCLTWVKGFLCSTRGGLFPSSFPPGFPQVSPWAGLGNAVRVSWVQLGYNLVTV
jgi:hypothetical protein